MNARSLSAILASCMIVGCSGDATVDVRSSLPGTWTCDEIVVEFLPAGRYEWRVPAGGPVHFASEGNEHVRVEQDGGYTLLGAWRLTEDRLELDMMGETDTYSVSFSSHDAVRLSGPEAHSCKRA